MHSWLERLLRTIFTLTLIAMAPVALTATAGQRALHPRRQGLRHWLKRSR